MNNIDEETGLDDREDPERDRVIAIMESEIDRAVEEVVGPLLKRIDALEAAINRLADEILGECVADIVLKRP